MSIFNFNLVKRQCQRYSNSNNYGFLLYEVAVSILLVSLLGLAMGSWYINLSNNHMQNVKRIEALFFGCSLLERIRAEKKIPQVKSDQYLIEWIVNKSSQIANLATVKIKIKWKNKSDIYSQIQLITEAILI